MEKPNPGTKPPKVKQLTSPVPPPPLPEKPGGEGGLVAKSPPNTPPGTLQSRVSEETAHSRDDGSLRLLTLGGLQLLSGVLMVGLGVLTLLHHAAMAQYGAGLWGGVTAAGTGLAGVLAGVRPEPAASTPVTVYLALCLVSVASTTLALVLTSTGLLRDFQQPAIYVPEDDGVAVVDTSMTAWAPVLSSTALLLLCCLLLVSLLVAVLRVYRLVCPCTRPPGHRLLESPASSHYATSKQGLVNSWLGQQPTPLLYPATRQPAPLIVYPPPLLMESPGLYTVPPSSVGYPQCISPLHSNPYMQRRRSPHPHRGRNSVTPDSVKTGRRQEKPRQREAVKEKEITDEQLEKTYTGLDREIAEEFISIAMNNSENRQRAHQLRPGAGDKVIDCIAPI